jgi:hypothetical protein
VKAVFCFGLIATAGLVLTLAGRGGGDDDDNNNSGAQPLLKESHSSPIALTSDGAYG